MLWHVLRALLVALAPVTSFLCEEAWQRVPEALKVGACNVRSVHLLQGYGTAASEVSRGCREELKAGGEALEVVRSAALAAVDSAMQTGRVENCFQVDAALVVEGDTLRKLQQGLGPVAKDELEELLQDYLRLSCCTLSEGAGTCVEVRRANGEKCPRCRRWQPLSEAGACAKCAHVLAHA